MPLGVAAAVADGDEDDRRDPLLVDQVVEDRLEAVRLAGAVVVLLGARLLRIREVTSLVDTVAARLRRG